MVQYSFMGRFVPRIEDRSKRGTIRRDRKRHARAGERIQLYTGDRFRPVKIGEAWCQGVFGIRLHLRRDWIQVRYLGSDDWTTNCHNRALCDLFAQRDGFDDWEAMTAWFLETHGDHEIFEGVWIHWGDTFAPQPQEST